MRVPSHFPRFFFKNPTFSFEMMSECWNGDPLSRPAIADLRLRLAKELEKVNFFSEY